MESGLEKCKIRRHWQEEEDFQVLEITRGGIIAAMNKHESKGIHKNSTG